MVTIGTQDIISFEQRRRRQNQMGKTGGIAEPGIDNNDKLARCKGASSGLRLGQHRNGIAGRDPDGANGWIDRGKHLLTEKRFAESAWRRDLLNEISIEGSTSFEIERYTSS